jgi:glutamate-1-semialdehyde 2,1-aminomutase
VRPDLWCFGKVIGGGLPLAAFAGTREVMAQLAPLGPVYQAGTLSGNPLATAAGLAVLGQLDRETHDRLCRIATRLADGLRRAIGDAGVAVQVPRVGPLVGLFFADAPVRNFDDANDAAGNGRYAPFFHAMLRRGVALAPGAYEAIFPSLAHTDELIDRTIAAAAESAAELLAST